MRKSIHTPEQAALIALLKSIRKEAKLTQVELAMKLGIDQSEVSNFERGEKRLDLIELKQVCEANGISLEEFVRLFISVYPS